jgi:pimeloyl-ACP methyl ester carboxylesterase
MSLEVAGSRRADINGAELEYWDIGSGPTVVFIHGGMGDECAAVLEESALTTSFRLIHFQRRGYGASSVPKCR